MNVSLKDIKAKYGPITVLNGVINDIHIEINPHFHNALTISMPIKMESSTCSFLYDVDMTSNIGNVLKLIYMLIVGTDDDQSKDLLYSLVKKNVRMVFMNENNPPIAIGHIIDDSYLLVEDIIKH